MARQKSFLEKFLNSGTMALEACAQKNTNVFKKMLDFSEECVPIPDDAALERQGDIKGIWELVVNKDGSRMLIRPWQARLEVYKAIAPYVAPQLKSSEHKTTEDKTITWVVKTYEMPSELKVLPPSKEEAQ